MAQDDFQRARERYEDAGEAMRENHERMREDLRFSNPADPDQWHKQTKLDRKGRPLLTLDQTNQFVQQVVNDGRQNTPSISTVPVDDRADPEVALKCSGLIRHVEYRSRAAIAYDTSLEYSARNGLGWLRVVPTVVDKERNHQEPRIFAVHDPLSCRIDGDSVEYDGSDAMWGFAETTMSESAFKRKHPKARVSSFGDSKGWCSEKGVRVAEYFEVLEEKANAITITGPDGGELTLSEDDYWKMAAQVGFKPEPIRTEQVTKRRVRWRKMSGVDFLDDEDTDFPADWIGLIPVYGHVVWVDGKRVVCGLTRRLMDGQRFHNYQMSSLAETLLLQPKAPFMAPGRAIEGYEEHWEALNAGNPSYLPYNDIDEDGQPVPAPSRLSSPQFPTAFAQAATLGVQEMQASVGMYKSNLGQQSNAVSGRAKIADKIEGDTATFHYVDNQRRSLEHLGRIVLQMTLRLVDTPRQMRILGLDDKSGTIFVDPEQASPIKRDGAGRVVAINPNVGEYDVRVKVGPGYTTIRQELKERLTTLGQGNPALGAALAPILVKLDDLPEADKVMRVCLALLPPNVQAAYQDEGPDGAANIPPQVKAQLQALEGQLKQAAEMMQQMQAKLAEAEQAAKSKSDEVSVKQADSETKAYEARTDRLRAAVDLLTAQAAAMQPQATEPAEAAEPAPDMLQGMLELMATVLEGTAANATGLTEAQQIMLEVAQAQAETQDQLGALTEIVTRPRVAEVEYNEAGQPVRAVGVLQQ